MAESLDIDKLAHVIIEKGLKAASETVAFEVDKIEHQLKKLGQQIGELEERRQQAMAAKADMARLLAQAVQKASRDTGIPLAVTNKPAQRDNQDSSDRLRRSNEQIAAQQEEILQHLPVKKADALSIRDLAEAIGRPVDNALRHDLNQLREDNHIATTGRRASMAYYRK
jgi:hypothetical protein